MRAQERYFRVLAHPMGLVFVPNKLIKPWCAITQSFLQLPDIQCFSFKSRAVELNIDVVVVNKPGNLVVRTP